MIASNHAAGSEHTLVVSMADAMAGAQRSYSIQGNSGHNHNVTITAAMFTTLRGGSSISAESTSGGSGNGHTHGVSVICA